MIRDRPIPPIDLWVVRHGQSTANVAFERAQRLGLEDSPVTGRDADIQLSPLGHRQATAFGRWLSQLPAGRHPEAIYCSPYRRARRTLEIALSSCAPGSPLAGIAVLVDDRLRDRGMGSLELLTPTAIERRFPDETVRRQQAGELEYRPPGGESLRDVQQRLRSFLETVLARPDRRALVIGHDVTMVMVRAITDGLGDTEMLEVMSTNPVRNAAIGHWKHTGRWQLVSYNDTSHLTGIRG